MIFLDVTSACLSPLNTGVKRMQRGLHSLLKTREDYLPVCWQSAWQSYRSLRRGDYRNLEKERPARGLQLYDNFAPGLLADWLHAPGDSFRLIDFFREGRPVDLLLLPDLMWDNRAPVLARLWETGVHRVAVFHDAIALRENQSRLDRFFCGRGIRALAEMDAVLCISQEAEKDLLYYWRKFRLPPTATFVLPWPVPFDGPRPETFPNFGARELLYVARIEEHKNHGRLLDACEILWRGGIDFSLRLIGCKAYPVTAWHLEARIASLQRRGRRIRWQPHVPEATLRSAYRDCSFTVFPSLREGFGLPILESLWHGRPVVSGGNGALGELAGKGGCAIANMHCVDGLAAAIRRLLTEPEHYNGLYQQALQRPFRTWSDYWQELQGMVR